jgi:serine/threonine protein kinase
MGTVYLAIDPTLERDVALKVLPPDFATDAERIDRFRREARALAATLMFLERDYEGARQGLSRLRFPLRPSAMDGAIEYRRQ